jgi:thiosulfate dehydrogenase (quinone) large subunit
MKTKIITLLRLCMSFIFLWAFFDKLFGLGFATTSERAWIHGGSPTAGFLSNAVHGPFSGLFHQLAGFAVVDWLFMLGLLGIGFALLTGIAFRFGVISGIVLLLLMYLAAMPPENNPLIDDHIIYALVLALLLALKRSPQPAAPSPM